ncbi:DUF2087 domain-containing protein [Micromonospora sp. NBC_01813]|uniref:DUF2087 domain-containing protein n=1 Tax=Micromonospora sp. NBC_01813 TaxID=2975988 RepID=UPI002DD7B30A|nr:DUF2087 domain-containing protein [Micromonospora sp. NBC_01813]WSA09632.1 DUF2087 domain-containing protein [Micromonospora sp. NBC_01813]
MNADLSPFVRDGRLVSLPARQARRRAVLTHIVEACFDRDVVYDEPAVDELLRHWCDGGDVDHVAVRRYVIEAGLMARADGRYCRNPLALPYPNTAERYVESMGLS